MRGRVLITRPEADCGAIAAAVQKKGYDVLCQPFLHVHYDEFSCPDLSQYDSLIFTSANGVRGFCAGSNQRDIDVLAVGDQTAMEAEKAGFKTVISAQGKVDDLAAYAQPEKSYLYVRGEYVSQNLKVLCPNVRIDEIIAYHTEKIKKIESEALFEPSNTFSHVLFFSKRTAEAFAEYIRAQGQENSVVRARALCLGDGMVECLSTLPWSAVEVAEIPNREGILALLD